MKAIFSGYYGAMNSGDDAFVEVSAWGSKKYWNSDEQLFFANQLPETRTDTSHYFAHKNYINFARAVKDIFLSDIFVSAGGSTFHSALTKTDLRSYAKLKRTLKFGGKTGAIGISLGPFKNTNAENNTLDYLKTLDFLALRDKKSYDLAKSYNLPYQPIKAFDLAALLPEIYNFDINKEKIKTSKESIVGISVCNYESYTNGNLANEERRNKFIIDLVNELKKNESIKFRFFIFNGNLTMGDEKLTKEIITKLNTDDKLNFEIIPYLSKVEETYHLIASCDVVVSTRLHASIFACYSNTPFFLLEYHRKCTDFLNDVGQSEDYRIMDAEIEVGKVVSEIEKILFHKKIEVPINLIDTIERSRLNFTATK